MRKTTKHKKIASTRFVQFCEIREVKSKINKLHCAFMFVLRSTGYFIKEYLMTLLAEFCLNPKAKGLFIKF